MFTHLKKNKKNLLLVAIIIASCFLLFGKKYEKSLEIFNSNKYLDNLQLNKEDLNLFFLDYKNLNEKISIENSIKKNILPRVAHAGGGFNEKIYTNSIDALEVNKNDFLFFELDLFVTGDNKVVCEHDYNEYLKTLKIFEKYLNQNKLFKQCTYISLRKWLNDNPNKIIITDFKNKNIEGLNFITKNFKNYENQFIPQIYHPKEYNKVKKLGFKNIIWTLYRYDKSNEAVLLFATKMNLYAVTMNQARARSGLANSLNEKNIRTYVHTINSVKEYFKYLKVYNVDQIYTDWIK